MGISRVAFRDCIRLRVANKPAAECLELVAGPDVALELIVDFVSVTSSGETTLVPLSNVKWMTKQPEIPVNVPPRRR